MCLLGQHASIQQTLTNVTAVAMREIYTRPQPSAPDRIDLVSWQVLEHLSELLAHDCGALLVLAGGQHADDLDADRAREWVPTERASVLDGPEHAENVASGYDFVQRHPATTERLAQNVDVRTYAL